MAHLYKILLCLFLISVYACGHSQRNNVGIDTATKKKIAISDSLYKSIQAPYGLINDYSSLFTLTEINSFDSLVKAYEQRTTTQIAIVTIDSTMVNDNDFENYTLAMLNKWGVGQKDKNNGILIAISHDLRRIRIQNGYGIEKILSDNETKNIIDSVTLPYFRNGEYFLGTKNTILALIKKLDENSL